MQRPTIAPPLAVLVLASWAGLAAAQTTPSVVYRCPGPPVLYTDQLSPQEAKERGCRTIEGAPVTVVQTPQRPRAPASAPAPARPADARVDPAEQRARDSDARRILSAELRREEERLAEMRREYNNGEPERLGNERNYQKYLDRVAEMKTAIERKESDIAAIKRELAKLPTP
jgi:Xaa-Pro aminopeptidase